MMPGAGLYLPASSHRVSATQPKVNDQSKSPSKTQRYLERLKPKLSQDSDRKSITLSRESSEDVARVFASLPIVFGFADFASTHTKVASDSQVFINLIQRVRQDVLEASRVYTSRAVTDYLESWPDKKAWIDTILLDIQRALNDIGAYVENVRVSGDDGGPASLRRKFEWVLSHHKKLMSKQQYLTLCHQSLMATVQVMQTAEINSAYGGQDPVYEVANRPRTDTNQEDILRSPYSRQRIRSSLKNLSLPSITVSEVDGFKAEVPAINSVPAELPASTPDDLPDPQNWDLYAPPRTRVRSLSVGDPPILPTSPNSSTSPHFEKQEEATPLSTKSAQAWPQRSSSRSPTQKMPTRKDFDQVRPLPTASVLTQPQTPVPQRPRAHSDQVQQFESKARASFDLHAKPMPTVIEKPLECYDTTATVHVSDAAPVPISTRRFRPKEVSVRKIPSKAPSLPNPLPIVSSTGSLMKELSQWVLPAGARTSLHGTVNDGSLFTATPATSGGSPPISEGNNAGLVLKDTSSLVISPTTTMPESAKLSPSTYSLFPSKPSTIGLPLRPPPPLSRVIPRVELPAVGQTNPRLVTNELSKPEVISLTLPPRPPPKEQQPSPNRSESRSVSRQPSPSRLESRPLSPDVPTSAPTPPPRSPLPPIPSQSGERRANSPIPGPLSRRRRPTVNTRKLQGDRKGAVQTTGTDMAPSEPVNPLPPRLKEDVASESLMPKEQPDADVSLAATESITADSTVSKASVVSPPPDISSKPLPLTPFPGSEGPVTAQSKRRVAQARRMQRNVTHE